MNALLRTGTALLCFSSLCQSGAAQQPAGQHSSIQLDVVVTDKSGKPVPGLTQQDFTVLDNKQPTPILTFHPHTAASVPAGEIDSSTNAPYDRAVYARQSFEKYLKQNSGKLDHPVSIGLFTDSGLQLQTQPSIDGNALAAALEKEGQTYRAIERGAVGGDFQRLQLSMTH